jgi:plasmid stabilization system protein ParE
MYKLQITPQAKLDLREIGDYIAQDNKAAARVWVAKLEDQCQKTILSPYGYVAVPEFGEGLRRASLGRYNIYFTIIDSVVRIDRVLHGVRDMNRIFVN